MASCDVINGCELHLRVVSRRLVKASDASIEPRVLAVSNLDLFPQQNLQISMFCMYPRPASPGDFRDVVAAFESGLPDFLNHFFTFAGRVVTNAVAGVPEVHCNNQGAELVVGEADVALSGVDYGTMGASLGKIHVPHAKDVPLSVQLVSFACGGFTVAWSTDHGLVDGHALCMLVSAWSELARSGTLAPGSRPSHAHSVFRPRATPSYSASLDVSLTPLDRRHLVSFLTRDHSFVERLYYVEAADIARLREEASRDGVRATRVQAVSAYLWKVLALVAATADTHCRMGRWVDGRPRLTESPELRATMPNYIGNAITYVLGEASVEEIQRRPHSAVASMARAAITAPAYGEHFQELVDWVEEHKAGRYVKTAVIGVGSPVVNVTAFSSFHLDTDFGFGDATMAMPLTMCGARVSTGFVQILPRPGGDGSWIVSAYIWPRLVAALEADERLERIFKPVTAEYLGLRPASVKRAGMTTSRI